ncbi:MAG: hypothetical protein CUN55_04790 [Phototrophicales bacterium]|nr:MAG: hypothetical protein CUN55_04790 [Phototrophicales bacterium]
MLDKFDRYMLSVIGVIILMLGGLLVYGDQVGVHVIDTVPSDGATIGVATDIRITFDQAVDRESAQERFQLQPAIQGEFRWRGASTLIFRPDAPLQPNQRYEVRIEEGIRSITGRIMDEPFRFSFTTQPLSATVYYLTPAEASRQGLWAINPDGSDPRPIFTPEFGIFSYAPSPDGTQLAVTVLTENAASADIWLINADGNNVQQLTDCAPGVCGQAAWSPNRDLLAYAKQTVNEFGSLSPARVWLWDLATNETAPVFEDNQVLGFYPIWSPNGKILSFYDSNATAIRLIELDSGTVRLIETQLPERWSFSPFGDMLAYSDLRSNEGWYYPQLVWINLIGQPQRTPILENPEQDQEPIYSPDGQWIVFRRRLVDGGNNGSQLMLYNIVDKSLREITTDPDYTNSNVQWSPDSTRIIFQRYQLRTAEFIPEIWLYDINTEALQLLVSNATGAQWSNN